MLLLIFLWKPLFIINLLNPNFWAVCAISFCLTENQTINLFKTCSKPKIVKKIIYILSFVFYPSLASLPGRCPWTAQDSRWALSCLRGCGLTFSVEQIVRLSAVKCIKSYSNSIAVLLDQIGLYAMFCHENCMKMLYENAHLHFLSGVTPKRLDIKNVPAVW